MKRNPLLVTDRGLAGLDITARTLGVMEEAGLGRGDVRRCRSESDREKPRGRCGAFRDGGHDGVIAFGGGSGLDLGKLIAFMAGQTRPVWDFEDIGDWWTRADAAAIAPIVAVPTTAGTGSEVGRAGVITNEARPM
jgi:alcohol dehydrogenase